MRLFRCCLALLLIFCSIGSGSPAYGVSSSELASVVDDTAAYLLKTVPAPQVGASGGEWTVIGLARSGHSVPQSYYDGYYNRLASNIGEHQGVLHDRKYTEYSRVVLALTALGKDPANVSGYNLLKPLGDFERTTWQGINGSIFALLALDSGNYDIPFCEGAAIQATRQMYVDDILGRQLADGGFSLSGTISEPDETGMALQALAKYKDQPEVQASIERALDCLSTMQNSQGGYESWGSANLESSVQVLMALCELGIDVNDSRFVKNGISVADNIMSFYDEGAGFRHASSGDGVNGMATEQAFYALVSLQRVSNGLSSLYDMGDSVDLNSSVDYGIDTGNSTAAPGLPGKNPDVSVPPLVNAGITFTDIYGQTCQSAVESLAGRGIITGLDSGLFGPGQPMSRAEFAAIVTRSLGLPAGSSSVFSDIPPDSWYSPYIGSAYAYGIVGGTTASTFSPDMTITREEAATMATRAALLCGINTSLSEQEIENQLAQFDDGTGVSPWARPAMAFCCRSQILATDAMDLKPGEVIGRGEIADMLYRMLDAADLL